MKHLLLLLALLGLLSGERPPRLAGTWVLAPEYSTPVDPWRTLTLDVRVDDDAVMIKRTWSASRGARGVDSLRVPPDGTPHALPVHRWVDNRHLGVRIPPNARRHIVAQWKDDGHTLAVEQRLTVQTSQGETPLRIYSEYRPSPDGTTLNLLELRSTRPRPTHYTFLRANQAD